MKIDLSTILLVIISIVPGLFAQRSRNKITPRSLELQGTSTELAELVALGISTHAVMVLTAAIPLLLFGIIFHHNPCYFFTILDSFDFKKWYEAHTIESALIAIAYVLLSFLVSYLLGFIYGIVRLKSPVTTKLLGSAKWLERLGVLGVLGELPIIYEVLKPEFVNGIAKLVFVELEMKDSLGFYSGQLDQFAIVKDEEVHKPIYLINVWFKQNTVDKYELLSTDGLMLDLSDVLTTKIKQI